MGALLMGALRMGALLTWELFTWSSALGVLLAFEQLFTDDA